MGKREDYTKCMIPYMTEGGPERKERFCIGAKICSSKASNEQEAAKLCAEAAANPKPPKAKGTRRGKIDISTLTPCIIKGLNGSEPTLTNLPPILASCTGQKAGKTGREAFIKNCFKENTSGNGFQYDIKEAQRLRSFCTAKWKEQEASI